MKKVNPTCWFHCWITTFLIVECHWKPQNCPLHSLRPFSAKSSIKFVENFHRRVLTNFWWTPSRPAVFITYIIMETKHTKNSSYHCLYVIVSSVSSLSKAKLSFNNPSVSQKSVIVTNQLKNIKDGDFCFVFRKLFWKLSVQLIRID